MFDFKMSAADVLAARQKLEWPQARMAYELGVAERTLRRWEREGAPSGPSHSIKMLLDREEAKHAAAVEADG